MSQMPSLRNAATAVAILLVTVNDVLQAQKAEKAEPEVTVEDVVITISPGTPIGPKGLGAVTLCDLKVRVRNRGTQRAASFGFGVKINGEEMAVYDKMVFMEAVD